MWSMLSRVPFRARQSLVALYQTAAGKSSRNQSAHRKHIPPSLPSDSSCTPSDPFISAKMHPHLHTKDNIGTTARAGSGTILSECLA